MRVTDIEITVGRTVPLGSFESYRTAVTMRAELNEGEDVEEAYEKLYKMAYGKLQLNVARVMPD